MQKGIVLSGEAGILFVISTNKAGKKFHSAAYDNS